MNAQMQSTAVTRREFLQVGTATGGALLLGLGVGSTSGAQVPGGAPAPPGGVPAPATLNFSAFIQIAPDGAIRIYSAKPDVGQGIKTSAAMTVAEEMDADWSRVTVEQSPVDNTIYGPQGVGGSRSTPSTWDPLRKLGASARALMIAAAAQQWSCPDSECSTASSVVTHGPTGRKLSYGELAARAASLPAPDQSKLTLKARTVYRLIGRRVGSVDNARIVRGVSLYGMDVRLPGMVYASLQRAPVFRAKVRSANLDTVKGLPGVQDVFVLEGAGASAAEGITGVVVVADSTWAAFSARTQLRIEWDTSAASTDSSAKSAATARELARGRGTQVLKESGNVDAVFASGARTIEAFYSYPHVSHAPMEPQNTTAWYRDGKIEMWAPVQQADAARPSIAQLLGIPLANVTLHLPRIGGGFGRRLMWDYMTEAALIAKRVNGPVKVVWTREDDMQFDYFRVGGFHGMKAALDANGRLAAWQDHFITFTADSRNSVSGGNMDPMEFPAPVLANVHLSQTMLPLAARCGPWRAPRSNGLAYPMQSFLHECSVAAGRDHVEFLLELFGEPRLLVPGNAGSLNTGRAAAVIRLAADKAGWGRKLPQGRGLGMAFYYSHQGHFAEVAEVSVSKDKRLTVHQVTVAADIGLVVNPLGAEQQAEGSVMDGLSTALGQRITIEGGVTEQRNFGDYPMMRIRSAPKVAVHFVATDYPPTGIGEPALPPVAPAICNAVFAACGERVRTLPLTLSGFSA
jgi:isoquinoline 1-oxidoreductase subunit beta